MSSVIFNNVIKLLALPPSVTKDFVEGDGKACLRYWKKCMTPEISKFICVEWDKLPFVQEMTDDGQKCLRRSMAFGPGFTYKYNGGSRAGIEWPPWLSPIKNAFEKFFRQPFEHALCIDYPNGAGIGEHCDDEKGIFPKSTIVALTVFGSTKLEICSSLTRKQVFALNLEPGSVYTMEGDFQKLLRHRIQKGAPRGSITFRHLLRQLSEKERLALSQSIKIQKPSKVKTSRIPPEPAGSGEKP